VVQETVTETVRLTDKSMFSAFFMTELLTSYRVAFRSVCCPFDGKAVCETHCVKWLKIVEICVHTAPVILVAIYSHQAGYMFRPSCDNLHGDQNVQQCEFFFSYILYIVWCYVTEII
jgi:hypothetical protein